MRLQDHLPQGVRIPGMLVASVLALLIATGFVIASIFTVFNAAVEPSVESENADVVASLLANNRIIERSGDRFTGRSVFYIPKAPREPRQPAPERPPPAPRTVEEPPPPPPPRIPATYAGPTVTGVLGNDVFFDNGERITEGESAAGVKVLLIRGPFDLRLAWSGGEYDVSLFSELPDYFTSVPFADGSRLNLISSVEPSSSTRSTRQSTSRSEPRLERPGEEEMKERIRQAREERDGANSSREIPEPLEESELKEMSRMDAVRALSRVNMALRSGEPDEETKTRLEEDRKRLEERIRAPSNPDSDR